MSNPTPAAPPVSPTRSGPNAPKKPIDHTKPKTPEGKADDLVYILPMAVFLGFTWVGGTWKELYPLSYVAKTLVVALIIWWFWKRYDRISWKYWWLGILFGIATTVQWIGMELLLLQYFPNYIRLDSKSYPGDPFIPFNHFESAAMAWGFIAIRWAGASLLVPVMEELFWRDYLWRTFLAPNNFRMARIGEWDLKAFLLVAIIFGAGVHIQWATAIVWGLAVGWLLVMTRSLGACIIMHAVTNFLLGAYVLYMHHRGTPQWFFW